MKRMCLFLMMAMTALTGWCASASSDPSSLVVRKVALDGSMMARMVQLLHVEVTNHGEQDYGDYWLPLNYQDPSFQEDWIRPVWVSIPAGETKEIVMELCFMQPGHYDCELYPVVFKGNPSAPLLSFAADIKPFVAPRVKCDVVLYMSETNDKGVTVYGVPDKLRVAGQVTIKNEEPYAIRDNTFFAVGEDGLMDAVTFSMETAEAGFTHYEPLFNETIREIGPKASVTFNFSYDIPYALRDNASNEMQVRLAWQPIVTIPLVCKDGINTYWTADGQVHQLPQDGMTLKVPADALAVDLRGNYSINGIFTIDASVANPNCLYYLNYMDYVPRGLDNSRQVIRDYERRDFVLNEDFDYYCPMPFTVKSALFTYTPESVPGDGYRSGTLVLPFDAQRAWLTAVNGAPGEDVGFDSPELTVSRYRGNDGDLLLFEPVSDDHLNAYEPYLISRVLPSPIAFYAENVTIPATRPAVAKGAEIDFVGSTLAQTTPDGFYRWSSYDRYFCQFDTDDLEKPFRALMVASYEEPDKTEVPAISGYQVLYVGGEQATAVGSGRRSSADTPQTVYTLSGQRLGNVSKTSLKPGLYIIGGRKTIIK